jgi:transposase
MGQMSLITGGERRRNWSDEEKLKWVAEAFGPGGIVADVARRADVGTGQLYRWRRKFQPEPMFVPAVVRGEADGPLRSGGGGIVVVFSGGTTVTIGQDASLALVKAALGALR